MKGVSKTAQKCFSFEDYFLCLQKQIMMLALEYRILSKKQQISSTRVQKVAVSGLDGKRFILQVEYIVDHIIMKILINAMLMNVYNKLLRVENTLDTYPDGSKVT